MKVIVKIKVIWGVIDGKTVCWNSWTKPLVIDTELLYTILFLIVPEVLSESIKLMINTCNNK